MDINTLIAFIAVTLWAFSKRKKGDFNEAANLPFDEDEDMPNKQSVENKQK